jgi:hypothetical protein
LAAVFLLAVYLFWLLHFFNVKHLLTAFFAQALRGASGSKASAIV